MQNRKLKRWSKTSFCDPIKKCVDLTAKIITAAHKSKVIQFKLDKDTLHHRVYLLYSMNSLKIVSLQVDKNYILLMEYQYIREEDLLDYNKNVIWNLLRAYIYAHSQRLINEYPGCGVQTITQL